MGIGRFVSRLLAICAVVLLTLMLVPGQASAAVKHKHKSVKHSKVHKKSKSKKKASKKSKHSKKKRSLQASKKKRHQRKIASVSEQTQPVQPNYEPTPSSVKDGEMLFPGGGAESASNEAESLPGLNEGADSVVQ